MFQKKQQQQQPYFHDFVIIRITLLAMKNKKEYFILYKTRYDVYVDVILPISMT